MRQPARLTLASVLVATAVLGEGAPSRASVRPAARPPARRATAQAPARRRTPVRPVAPHRPAGPRTSPRRPLPAPRRAAVRRPAPPHPLVVVRAASAVPTRPTGWAALDRAIARIPSYHGTGARWLAVAADGYWGTADWNTGTIYVSPRVPANRLYDVAVHEWSHLLSVLPYRDANDGIAAMRTYFGGEGITGAERAADCMARLQGATWTHYTPCTDARWRAGAARLLRGERL